MTMPAYSTGEGRATNAREDIAIEKRDTSESDRVQWTHSGTLSFLGVHLVAVAGVAVLGWSWKGVVLALAFCYLRIFAITAGYHRYFSHRTYKTSRVFQFLLALLGTMSVQKGVLWWAAHHRAHHKYSDSPRDIHSARQRGFWWSHVGWILSDTYQETDWKRIPDFAKYPELRWLNKHYLVPPVALAVGIWLVGSWHALLWGFFVSTVLCWHFTFTINSFTHLIGRRRYKTTDDSRNSLFFALLTLGEGWHNNHHYYQASVNQGFFWWEIDITYYILKVLSWMRVVWDLKKPPKKVLYANRVDAPEKPEKEPAALPVAVRAATSMLPPS
jgi:stearoyl-CoA desaturase (delta-9 desaturase)